MKKKHLLLSLILLSTVGLATGCKNESKTVVDKPTVSAGAVDRTGDIEVLSSVEDAQIAKKASRDAWASLARAERDLEKARGARDELQGLLTTRVDATTADEALNELMKLDVDITVLESEVSFRREIAKSKRALLNEKVAKLSEVEKAEVGEADIDFQVSVVAEKAAELRTRAAMSYDAEKIILDKRQAELRKINDEVLFRQEQMEIMMINGHKNTDDFERMSAEVEALEERRLAANEAIMILTASLENLAAVKSL